MSNLLRKLTSRGLSFSHLATVTPLAADDNPPADDKEGKQGKKADDNNTPPDDQNRDDGDSSGKKGKAEGDEPDKDDKDGKKGKKAEKDEPDADDDDDEEEMRGNSASAQARQRERARCATIMGSKFAARNVVLAANLAFKTTMTRQQALAVLEETPGAAVAAPADRRNPNLGNGGDRQASTAQAIQSSWGVAMTKAQGKKR